LGNDQKDNGQLEQQKMEELRKKRTARMHGNWTMEKPMDFWGNGF
jgi:hypothetical protein